MPSAPFIATMSLAKPGAIQTNLKPFRIDVQKAASSPKGPLPYATQSESPPSTPNVWFQLWYLGQNEAKNWHGWPDMKPPPADNQLCFEAPGYIQETQQGYEFRLLGDIKKGSGNQLGWIWLAIHDARGNPIQKDGREPRMPLVAAGADDEMDVVCTLQSAAGNTSCPTTAHTFSFTNLTHVIGSQLREGGLITCFNVFLPDSKNENDKAMPAYGRFAARRMHALGLKDGELCIGSIPFTAPKDEALILEGLTQLRDKVKQDFFGGTGEAPKVNRLMTITHGESNQYARGILCGASWLKVTDTARFGKFMDGLAPHLTDDAVWGLYACHCGAGLASGDVSDFGKLSPDRKSVGTDAVADVFRRELAKRGRSNAAIWAHTSRGDALLNQELRAFTQFGNMDLCYLTMGFPASGQPIGAAQWAFKFEHSWSDAYAHPDNWYFVDVALKHPGALIRSKLGG
jgi:hypothetical protein